MSTSTTPALAGALSPAALFAAGYEGLISITPPAAPLAPGSKLTTASLGKAPGRRLPSGLWIGYNWRAHTATEDDLRQWAKDGANVGLRSDRYPSLDIDCLDEAVAGIVANIALEMLGPAPVRYGRAPKRLLLYRLADGADPISRMRLHLDKKTAGGNESHLIELLGRGSQFLVWGIHPATLAPYRWDNGGPPAAHELTPITRAQVEQLFERLVAEFEALGWTCSREGDGYDRERANVEQSALVAPSIDALQDLVAKIPNTDALFPGRGDYITMGVAIRAAAGNDIEAGLDAFSEWASRHVKDHRVQGNPETARADYERFRGPFSIGWPWLEDQARRAGHSDAPLTFDVVADAPVAPPPPAPTPAPPKLSARPFADVTPQRTEWLLPGRIARQQITTVNGWPGEGKTSVMIDITARLSQGQQLPDGTKPPRPLRVLFLSTEDSESVLKLRLAAAGADMRRVLTIPDTELHHLKLPSRKATWVRLLRELAIDVIVTDPMKAFLDDGLDDIREQHARQFMMALRQVAEEANVAAVCIRHPNKATAGGHSSAVTSASGNLAFTAAARIELVVGRMPDNDEVRALAPVKNNLAAPPVALLYTIVAKEVPFDDGGPAEKVAAIKWQGVDADVTGDDLLARREDRESRSKLTEAKAFLANFLEFGPVERSAVLAAAKKHGISDRTLERARRSVGWAASVGNLRTGGKSIWGLPGQSVADFGARVEHTGTEVGPANLEDITGAA